MTISLISLSSFFLELHSATFMPLYSSPAKTFLLSVYASKVPDMTYNFFGVTLNPAQSNPTRPNSFPSHYDKLVTCCTFIRLRVLVYICKASLTHAHRVAACAISIALRAPSRTKTFSMCNKHRLTEKHC